MESNDNFAQRKIEDENQNILQSVCHDKDEMLKNFSGCTAHWAKLIGQVVIIIFFRAEVFNPIQAGGGANGPQQI